MNLKILWHICGTYDCNYLPQTIFHFFLIDFQFNKDFPSKLCIFYCKITSITQRSVSQEKCYKKSKSPSFFCKNIGSSNSFTLIKTNFRFFKIARFEFKVTVHCSLWAKCTQLWPLNKHNSALHFIIPVPAVDTDLFILF